MVLRFFFLTSTFLFISCAVPERDNPNDLGSKNYRIISSSSVESSKPSSSSNLCTGFVTGTKRGHYGKEKEQFCDYRDGKKYVYVEIGTNTWMAENLNYNAPNSKCYGDNTGGDSQGNCVIYGRLYNWATAKVVCPSGWHLPSYAEWNVLITSVGGTSTAGTKLKTVSGWYTGSGYIAGSDYYGFSALPGGYGFSVGGFDVGGSGGLWWSSSEDDSGSAYDEYMNYSTETAKYGNGVKDSFLSVRCVKD